MIVLGIILLIAGFVLKISILWTIGIVLLVIGVVLAILDGARRRRSTPLLLAGSGSACPKARAHVRAPTGAVAMLRLKPEPARLVSPLAFISVRVIDRLQSGGRRVRRFV
jgi:hypothetical protein